jgi:uncharacterized protein YndB with AHSA1/START domain
VLKEAGLVAYRRDGNRRLYAVDPKGVDVMRTWFDSFWSEALSAFQGGGRAERSTMTEQATANAVRHTVSVPIVPERAFKLFTEDIGTWWPSEGYKISEGPITEVFEPRQGGRWYELAEDGSQCTVGTVLVWDPPRRLVFAWQLTPDWTLEPDLDRATQVEVTFEDEGGSSTRVTLEHRGFEAYGDSGRAMRDQVGSEGGWPALLKLYGEVAGK